MSSKVCIPSELRPATQLRREGNLTLRRPQPGGLTCHLAHGVPTDLQVLHETFEAQADARPDAVAVVFGQQETTYGELEQQANRFAHHLRACGVRRGSLVALLLPRSTDAYAAILRSEERRV